MSDEITLPRSGVVLVKTTIFEDRGEDWSDATGCARFYVGGASLRAYCIDDCEDFSDRDVALAWLDERVLSLRAALLPGDARTIIRDTVKRCIEAPPNRSETDFALDVADAVLDALGGKP